ncbi:helicase-like transcription factor isoform X2, partial [Silurus asotus]
VTMCAVKAEDVKRGIAVIWENLQCPICLDLMSEPVSTRCDHQFCRFCMAKLLERSKRKEASCPVCKTKVTKRSLQESPGFQKLVEGLRNLVQSYEYDTGTNYFTGFPQRRRSTSVETESRDQQGSGGNTSETEKEATPSSSAAAKDAFAKLMCLEDSSADAQHQLSSHTSPADSAQKPAGAPLRIPGADSAGVETEEAPGDVKPSLRRSKRLGLEPDRIPDQRQKKSVQKVSEWLLKISPTADESTVAGDRPGFPERDAEEGSTASRASTEIHDVAMASPLREAPCRGLEERVFGAVYKRERRVSKTLNVTRGFSPEREILTPKRRSSRKSTPADFIRRTSSGDKEDGDQQEEPDKTKKEEKPLSSSDQEEPVVQSENTEESPAFEVPLKKPRRRSKMQEVWKVDRDLTEIENADKKKDGKRRVTRSSRDATKEDAKCALDLIRAGSEDLDLMEKVPHNPKVIETEVDIESYPSSADAKSPDARKTRRSARLQEFTAEVRGPPSRRRVKPGLLKRDEGPENNPPPNPREPNAEAESSVRRNGCVYNDDLENIEAVQSSEDPSIKCPSQENLAEDVSLVPDTVDQDENVIAHSLRVAEFEAGPVPESLPQKCQESPSTKTFPPGDPEQEDDTNDSELDTEQLMKTFKTTKRKSFYLGSPSHSRAQEKSLTQISEEDQQENVDHAEIPPNSVDPDHGLAPNACEIAPREVSSPTAQSGAADVLSVSLLQVTSADVPRLPEDTKMDNSLKTLGASEHPEKVQGSRPPLNSELGNSVQLFSATTTQEEPRGSHRKTSSPEIQGNQISSISLGRSSEILSNNLESSVTPDGLVPEVLVMKPATNENLDEMDEGEIPSQPRVCRKRKAQRLESSDSESSVENDDLPPLAQLLKSHRPPSDDPVKIQAEEPNPKPGLGPGSQESRSHSEPEAQSTPSQCIAPYQKPGSLQDLNSNGVQDGAPDPPCRDDWMTSSQGSVDLFGTPRQCDEADHGVCGNTEISGESSQFSSEIINTQVRCGNTEISGESSQFSSEIINTQVRAGRSHSEPEAQSSPSQCIAPYQKPGSLQDLNSNGVQDGAPDPPCRDDWMTSSQGSVDLFGTPRQCDEADHGVCGNTEISGESSQFSSEIINTQQREEMQQELNRLERMMALVSDALQKKDGDSGDKMEDDDGQSGQRGRMRSQRGCKSGKQASERSEVGGQRAEGSAVEVNVEKDASEPRGRGVGERSGKKECWTGGGGRMEMVMSGLSANEQGLVKKFARKMKAGVSSQVTPTTTHIIIKTDGDLVCERTLKYFQGIAGRKWMVSFLWISECFKHSKLLTEVPYEVCGDVVNGHDHNGPRKARTASDHNLLMKGCEICFQGSFTDMTSDQMAVMVEQCGATVMKDPLMFSRKDQDICYQLVVVQPGPDDSQSYYTGEEILYTLPRQISGQRKCSGTHSIPNTQSIHCTYTIHTGYI